MSVGYSFASCLLCHKQFENFWTHSVEDYRGVYASCVKYLSDDIKGDYFYWNENDIFPHPPFCTLCFRNAEKIFEIDVELLEIQRRLSDSLILFNLEILNARNDLIIQENLCDTSNDLESFHARLLKAPNEISFIENIYTSGLEDLSSQILNPKSDATTIPTNNIKISPVDTHQQKDLIYGKILHENINHGIQQENSVFANNKNSNLECLQLKNGLLHSQAISGAINNDNFGTETCTTFGIINQDTIGGDVQQLNGDLLHVDIPAYSKPCNPELTNRQTHKKLSENTFENSACLVLNDPFGPGNIYAGKTLELENSNSSPNQIVQNLQNENNVVEAPCEAETVQVTNVTNDDNIVYYVVRKDVVPVRQSDDYSELEATSFDEYVANWSGDEEIRETEILIRDLKVHKLEEEVEECNKFLPATQNSTSKEGAAISIPELFSAIFVNGDNRCYNETDGAQSSIVLPNCEDNRTDTNTKSLNAISVEQRQELKGHGKINQLSGINIDAEQVNILNSPYEEINNITESIERIISVASAIENINAVSPSLEEADVSPIANFINLSPIELGSSAENVHVEKVTFPQDNIKVTAPSVGKVQSSSPVENTKVVNYIVEEINKIVSFPPENIKVVNSPVENPKIVNFSSENIKVVNSPVENPKIVNFPPENIKVVNSPVENPTIVNFLPENIKVVNSPVENPKIVNFPPENIKVVNSPVENTKIVNFPPKNIKVVNFPVENPKIVNSPPENIKVVNSPVENPKIVNFPPENIKVVNSIVENPKIFNFPPKNIKVVNSPVENPKIVNFPPENIKVVNSPVENPKIVNFPPENIKVVNSIVENPKIISSPPENIKINSSLVEKTEIVNSLIEKGKIVNFQAENSEAVNSVEETKVVNFPVENAKIVNFCEEKTKIVNIPAENAKVVNFCEEKTKIVNIPAEKAKVAKTSIKINVMIPPLKFKTSAPIQKINNAVPSPVLKEVNAIPTSALVNISQSMEKKVIREETNLHSLSGPIHLNGITKDVEGEGFTFHPRKPKTKRKIKKEHPVKGYLCQGCEMTFPLTVDLDLHSLDTGHQNDKDFNCSQCENKYYKIADLKYHQRAHKKLVMCTICHKTFQNKGNFKTHSKSHSENYPTCKICSLKFATEKDLAHHAKEHEKTANSESKRKPRKRKESQGQESTSSIEDAKKARKPKNISKNESVETFQCNICKLDFAEGAELEWHCLKSGHRTEKSFECSQCPNKYYRKMDLKSHVGTHKGIKIFICSICSTTFTDNLSFKDHFRIHAGSYPECQQCGIKFAKVESLNEHVLFHHKLNKNPHECNEESKTMGVPLIEENISTEKEVEKEEIGREWLCELSRASSSMKGYLCQVCSTVFTHSAYLDVHILESGHKNEKTFSCVECSKKFFKKRDLHYHKRIHRAPVTYPCNICPAVFKRKLTMKKHLRTHPGFPECKDCGMKFPTDAAVEEHVKSHIINDMFKCEVCHDEFKWKISLKYHQKRFHGKIRKVNSKRKANSFDCDYCLNSFDSEKSLEEHMKESGHSTEKKFKCPTCQETFYRLKDVQIHQKIHSKNKSYACEVCNRIFSKNYKLTEHMRVHSGDFYSCFFCSSKFTKKLSLERHLERHSGLIHVCEFCGKSFKDKGRYRNHRRLHTGEYYLCDLCPKKCYTKRELNDHNNIHKGLKPHRCHICDKSFCTVTRLQNHKVTHRSKESVSCSFCKKTFDTQKKLDYHMKVHTEEAYQCSFCDKQYPSSQILSDHIKFVHQGEKEFPCIICGKILYSKTAVIQHQRNHLAENRANNHANNNNSINIPNKNTVSNSTDIIIPNNNNLINNIPNKPNNGTFNIPNGDNVRASKNNLRKRANKFKNDSSTQIKNNPTNKANTPKIRNRKIKKKLPFPCHLCQDSFKRPEHLRKHIVEHDYPKPSFHKIVFKQD